MMTTKMKKTRFYSFQFYSFQLVIIITENTMNDYSKVSKHKSQHFKMKVFAK